MASLLAILDWCGVIFLINLTLHSCGLHNMSSWYNIPLLSWKSLYSSFTLLLFDLFRFPNMSQKYFLTVYRVLQSSNSLDLASISVLSIFIGGWYRKSIVYFVLLSCTSWLSWIAEDMSPIWVIKFPTT